MNYQCIIVIMKQLDYSVSKKVGRYIVPVLAVLFWSEIKALDIYRVPASPQLVFLNGFVLCVFGFYLVSVHNVWTKHWPVLITLSAWGATVLGVLRLLFPDAPQAPVDSLTRLTLLVFAALEVLVTVKSYEK